MFHTLLAAHALASPQSELLRLMDEADADPVVGISCHPVAPMTDLLQTLDLPGFSPLDAPEGTWMWLLTPSRLASAGVDVESSLSVMFFDDREVVVDLGFRGSDAQASTIVGTLLGLDDSTVETFSWQAGRLLVDGRKLPSNVVDVRRVEGRLTVRAGIPSASGPTALRRIVRRRDPGTGCAMTFDGPLPQSKNARATGKSPTHVTGMVHVPLSEGAPATVRFQTREPVPTALTAPAPPVGGSSRERPAVLLAIGVSLGDLLLDPALRASIDIAEQDVVELLSQVRFGAGATVAFFGDDPHLGFVANLDVARADGRQVAPRRARRVLQRVLSRLDVPTERRSATELSVQLPKSKVWVAMRPGGLVVGSDPTRVAEAARGEGEPWVRPPFAALAAAHPVAMRSEGVHTDLLPPVAADLGIRTAEGLWELTFGMEVDEDRKAATHAALATTIAAIVLPHVLSSPPPAD